MVVLIPSSDLRERLIRILEGLGGQAGCHMYWALGLEDLCLDGLFCVRWVLLGGVTCRAAPEGKARPQLVTRV